MASLFVPRPHLTSWSWSGRRSSATRSFSARFPSSRKVVWAARCCSIRSNNTDGPKSTSPWLMLPPSMDGSDMVYDFYRLADDKVLSFNKRRSEYDDDDVPADDAKFVGSSNGWIACYNYNHGKGDGNLFLSDPLSQRRHRKLPSGHNLPQSTGPWSGDWMNIENVVISSADPGDRDCLAVMIYGTCSRLACCCPRTSSGWIPLGNKEWYRSTVYSTRQKLFFCYYEDVDGAVEAWDLTCLHSPTMIPMKNVQTVDCFSFEFQVGGYWRWMAIALALCEKTDDLYQVRRFITPRMAPDGSRVRCRLDVEEVLPHKTTDFDVYRYDKEAREWKYMDSHLDGAAIFVGKNSGFVLSAADYPELKPDAIYFTDIGVEFSQYIYDGDIGGGHDIGIYNYRTKTISPCYYPCDYASITKLIPPPFWFTPNTFN